MTLLFSVYAKGVCHSIVLRSSERFAEIFLPCARLPYRRPNRCTLAVVGHTRKREPELVTVTDFDNVINPVVIQALCFRAATSAVAFSRSDVNLLGPLVPYRWK